MNINVIDNFVDKSYHKSLLDLLSGQQFQWTYLDNIAYSKDKMATSQLPAFGLAHMLYCKPDNNYKSEHYGIIDFIAQSALHFSGCNEIHRIRAAMSFYANPRFIHQPHIDYEEKHIAAVYYVNESDGETVIYKDQGNEILQTVEPKPNRIVFFDGNLWHTNYSPNEHKNRIILNFNFI